MAEEERKVNKIKEDSRLEMLEKSPNALPTNPYAKTTMTAEEIRGHYYRFALDPDKSLFKEINRIADETESALNEKDVQIQSLEATKQTKAQAQQDHDTVLNNSKAYTDERVVFTNESNNTRLEALEEKDEEKGQEITSLKDKVNSLGISLDYNETNGKLKVNLTEGGNVICSTQEIDLPIEEILQNASFDSENKQLILTFRDENKSPIVIDISDLVDTYLGDGENIEIEDNQITFTQSFVARILDLEEKKHTHPNKETLDSLEIREVYTPQIVEIDDVVTEGSNGLIKSGAVYSANSSIYERLQEKQNLLVSGENIKTINNQSILGSGNIEIQGGSGGSALAKMILTGITTTSPSASNACKVEFDLTDEQNSFFDNSSFMLCTANDGDLEGLDLTGLLCIPYISQNSQTYNYFDNKAISEGVGINITGAIHYGRTTGNPAQRKHITIYFNPLSAELYGEALDLDEYIPIGTELKFIFI